MALAFISHPDCARHRVAAHHPETAERLAAIDDRLIASGLDSVMQHFDAPLADRAQLARVHDEDYIDAIEAEAPGPGDMVCLDEGDTVMTEHSLAAARRAAGAAVLGVDLVMENRAHAAFCCVRPPGHHAETNRAMGFCIFNNVAVGAAHALAHHGLERVAIVDFDVHHGNGTEQIFKSEPRILFCSTFQHPFYPFTGHEAETANLVDAPLPAGTGSDAFRGAILEHWLPALDQFQPQLLMISAGFDGHVEEDMAHFMLMDDDYAWITRQLTEIARRHAGGRIVSCLEGGYALSALGRSAIAHLRALID
ncbi:MAG TPA: histone deacetylase family protein [Wenzhouxiangellaceae bacterium]|nr:histone deacetylase family protein [Wenzhouxiangellaceae bacterium]